VGESVLAAPVFARGADGGLACEGVSLATIAATAGTPAYVYSAASVRGQFEKLDRALAGVPHRVHYSVKANSSLAVLALLRSLGAGVDIVSGGELHRALAAGFTGADVVFSGVGKTEREIREALEAGVRFLNVESEGELRAIDRVARDVGVRAPVALRVNPEVSVSTPHPYTRTGERGNKFGIEFAEAVSVAHLALALPGVRLVGFDMHIGSQVSSVDPYVSGIGRLLELVRHMRAAGAAELSVLDVGGGFAVTYENEVESDLHGFAELLRPLVADAGLEVVLEPGRFLVGNAGLLLTRVLYRKRSGGKEFVITDAGMTELLRPSHYNAFHRIEAVGERRGRHARVVADVVGPVCETGDFFALDRELEDVAPGELLAVHSAGAYGYVMSSNYNSRPRAAEVLVDGERFAVVTERETYDDLVAREHVTPTWRTA
jgi:diaminopimelate decarboxylase